jgi:small nuclear ribonucleoprotein (snRNP)-like protein
MRRVLKQRVRLPLIVTLKSRVAYRGVLFDHDDQAVVLRNAELLTPSGPTPVDGELIVFVADVDTVQML